MQKVFEALSSAPRRKILGHLSKIELTAGEITVTNASGAIPAAATDAMRRMIFFMYWILPNGSLFKRVIT